MKKIYFFVATLCICLNTWAQCTINGSNITSAPGVYPAAANLLPIQQGVSYDQTIQTRIVVETDIFLSGPTHVKIDSVQIDSIVGLPPGISWVNNPSKLRGDSLMCLRFTGTTNAIAGKYYTTIYGKGWSTYDDGVSVQHLPYQGDMSMDFGMNFYYLTVQGPYVMAITNITKQDVTCYGYLNGQATATVNGGTNVHYSWSNGSGGNPVTGLYAGTYTVTATNNQGTSATGSVTIDQPTQIVTTGSSTASTGSNGTATVSASGGTTPYSYLWNNSQTTATSVNLAPGNYNVTVTDANQCTTIQYITVSQGGGTLSATASKTDVTCFGAGNGTASVNVSGGSNYVYQWSNSATGPSVTGLTPGTYTVTVTSGSSTATASVIITQPTLLTASAGSTPSTGNDGTATVTPSGGTPGYAYLWSNQQSAATITNLVPGTYTVTVTDNKGCTATASTVVNSGTSTLSATINKTDITCFGAANGTATVIATGNGNYTYLWNNNATTATISGLSIATYTVTVTSGSSTVTASVSISQPPLLTVNASGTASAGNDGTATANVNGGTSPYTYSWSSGQTTATITGLQPGNYTVIVSDNKACSASASVTVAVTGIEETEAIASLKIYPNPADDVLSFTAALNHTGSLLAQIVDISGRVVSAGAFNVAGVFNATINCSNLPEGVYTLQLTQNAKVCRQRFIINH